MIRLLTVLLYLVLAAPLAAQEPADLILHNGKVVTVDDHFSIHSAVAVRGGRILSVGGQELLGQYRADRTIDLGGRMLLPGFHDAHMHLWPLSRRSVDLTGVASIAELKARVRDKRRELGPGEWITAGGGYGWSEFNIAERRPPNRRDLDDAAPDNPVYLASMGNHSYAANSLALDLAQITRETPDPEGGRVERDASGEPTGIFREGPATALVFRAIPRIPSEETEANAISFLHGLLAKGITSIVEAFWSVPGYGNWERVYAEHGDSLPRATVQVEAFYRGDQGIAGAVHELQSFRRRTGEGDDRLRVGAVKLIVDGGYSGASAATLEPYANDPDWHGTLRIEPDSLYVLAKAIHELGWQMGFHTIGDAAIKQTVDVYARVLEESPRPDHRHYLTHFTVLPPEETLRQMAEHEILIVQQPNFTYTNDALYREYLAGERLEHNNPLRTPRRHGLLVAFGSDNLPLDPLVGIEAAVTRRGRRGQVFGAEEAVTVEEAIRAYTRFPAHITFEEETKGSIEPGKLADMVILSDDLLNIEPERISDVRVEATILGGKIVYGEASAFP